MWKADSISDRYLCLKSPTLIFPQSGRHGGRDANSALTWHCPHRLTTDATHRQPSKTLMNDTLTSACQKELKPVSQLVVCYCFKSLLPISFWVTFYKNMWVMSDLIDQAADSLSRPRDPLWSDFWSYVKSLGFVLLPSRASPGKIHSANEGRTHKSPKAQINELWTQQRQQLARKEENGGF